MAGFIAYLVTKTKLMLGSALANAGAFENFEYCYNDIAMQTPTIKTKNTFIPFAEIAG